MKRLQQALKKAQNFLSLVLLLILDYLKMMLLVIVV